MSARQNARYRGGLLVSAGAVLWSLVQVLEAVCTPWVRGPEYAPLYAGQLRVFGVLGGIGLAALLAFLALYLRKKKKEGWQIPTIPHPEMVLRGLISFGLPVPWRLSEVCDGIGNPLPRRFYIFRRISLWKQKKRLRNIMMDMTRMSALFRNTAWWNTLPR